MELAGQTTLFTPTSLVCPRCGGISPNRWHFDTNHGAMGNSDLCISQHLAKAHVQSAHRDGDPEHIAATTARARELRVPTP